MHGAGVRSPFVDNPIMLNDTVLSVHDCYKTAVQAATGESIELESHLKLQQEIFMNWQESAKKQQERLLLVSKIEDELSNVQRDKTKYKKEGKKKHGGSLTAPSRRGPACRRHWGQTFSAVQKEREQLRTLPRTTHRPTLTKKTPFRTAKWLLWSVLRSCSEAVPALIHQTQQRCDGVRRSVTGVTVQPEFNQSHWGIIFAPSVGPTRAERWTGAWTNPGDLATGYSRWSACTPAASSRRSSCWPSLAGRTGSPEEREKSR